MSATWIRMGEIDFNAHRPTLKFEQDSDVKLGEIVLGYVHEPEEDHGVLLRVTALHLVQTTEGPDYIQATTERGEFHV